MNDLHNALKIYCRQYNNVKQSSLEHSEKKKLYVEISVQCDHIERQADAIELYKISDIEKQQEQREIRKKILTQLEKLRQKCRRRYQRLTIAKSLDYKSKLNLQ
jgi:hypothetical protein